MSPSTYGPMDPWTHGPMDPITQGPMGPSAQGPMGPSTHVSMDPSFRGPLGTQGLLRSSFRRSRAQGELARLGGASSD